MQLWLFDAPPVKWCEVWRWVEDVAGIPRTSWRAAQYARQWNVIGKIQAEKRQAIAESIRTGKARTAREARGTTARRSLRARW